jgi:FO synthase
LHPEIRNIQTSWVKMGASGAALCLQAGANDLGGTLMNESITRAAGGVNGQEFDAASLAQLIVTLGRRPRQRTTLYGTPVVTSFAAVTKPSVGVLNEYSFERGGSQWRGA